MNKSQFGRRKYLLAVGASVGTFGGCIGGGNSGTEITKKEKTSERASYQLKPGTYESIAIFRNDDPRPEFQSEALRNVEEIFIDAAVPLTHAVIPAMPGSELTAESDFCGDFQRNNSQDGELIDYSLHGLRHRVKTDFYGNSEFGDRSLEVQRREISNGAAKLEDCVSRRPKSFVPPYNTYDETTVQALLKENIHIVSGATWFTDQYYRVNSYPFKTNNMLHVPGTHDIVADWQTMEFVPLEDLKTAFDEVNRLFVCMLHYQHFTSEDRLTYLEELVSYIEDDNNVGCMTLGGFGDAYLTGDLKWIDNSWDYTPNAERERS